MDAAVQDLLWIAKRFKGIVDTIPELEKLVNLSNRQKELESSIDKLKKEEDHLKSTTEAAKQYSEDMKFGADTLTKEVVSECKKLVTEAQADAKEIVKKANTKADEIIAKANEELEQVKQNILDKTRELYVVAADVDANLTRLKQVKDELAKLKDKI